jgi:predicted ATPase/DNA-binding CsgD family transcriptional regulator
MAPTDSQRERSSPQDSSEGRDSFPPWVVGSGREDCPAAPASRTPRGNLPAETSSFVGRERELSEVRELLAETRLLTLTGPGGCGKTRLALRVAREAAGEFGNGVWWVDLASLSDPDLIAQAVARLTGVREVPGLSLLRLLIEHLESGEALLVLDNCEHVIEACAALVDALLEGCPGLKVLTTSRESLRLYGEASWLVPSLSVPEKDARSFEILAGNEAVRLFAERARAVSPGFALTDANASAVARICQRLDGMPLAIELAAASLRVLSPHQVLRRLDDRFLLLTGGGRTAPPRNRTLRTTVDWSYDLLSEGERALFRRLSVFVGGFTLEAAEEVCSGAGVERRAVLGLLSGLVQKSLLVVVPGGAGSDNRYRMLETIRAYALEKLEASGEGATLRSRHADFFLELAEEAEPELLGPEQAKWLERLEREHDNSWATLLWLGERGEVERALRLGSSLRWFRGYFAERRSRLSALLEMPGAQARTAERAKALHVLGVLTCRHAEYADDAGKYAEARRYQEEALSIYRELGDKRGTAAALNELSRAMGMATGDVSTWKSVRPLLEEALSIYRELGDAAHGLAHSLLYTGIVEQILGNAAAAHAFFEESLELFRELGDEMYVGTSIWFLARAQIDEGDHAAARAHLKEVLETLQPPRYRSSRYRWLNRWFFPRVLEGVAQLAAAEGKAAQALRLAGAAAALRAAIGAGEAPPFRTYVEQRLKRAWRALGEKSGAKAFEEGRALTPEEALSEARQALGHAAEETPARGAGGGLLSAREVEVLRLVAEGLTDRQVAQKLYISPRTVGVHLRSIYRKLSVPSRAAAVKEAVERGVI